MDKSKNRTDMLAAGRMKLQQFRQKKDNKGGGSHAKPSSKVTNPGNESESMEPSKMGLTAPESAVVVDANLSDGLASGADQRVEELRFELEQPPADFDNQEANGVVLEKSNGSSSSVSHDLEAASLSGVSHEVSGTFSSSEVVHEGGGDLSVSYVNSHTENSVKDNGGSHLMEKGAIWRENSSSTLHEPVILQETNVYSLLADRVLDPGLISLSEEIEKDTYPVFFLENADSFQITRAQTAISNEGVSMVSGVESEKISYDEKVDDQEKHLFEDKLKETSDLAVYGSPRSEETGQYFNAAEESQDVGMNLCHESDEGTYSEKKIEIPSSQEILVNNEELQFELGGRANERVIEHCFLMNSLPANVGCQGKKPEEDVSVNEIIADAHKEGLSTLPEHIKMGSPIEGQFEQDGVLMKGSSAIELEIVKKHIYLSYIAKDILQLQMVEQTQLNEDFRQHSSYEVRRLFDLVKKAKESNEMLIEELVQCKSELQILAIIKDEIETNCFTARKEVEQEHIKCFNLKSELHKSQEDLFRVSNELAIYRGSVDALQMENSNLLASLISETHAKKKLVEEVDLLSSEQMKLTAALTEETDARKKITEEREFLSIQSMNLLSELTSKEEKLQIALEKKIDMQDNLRELWSSFEQLVEDNFDLSCNLDIRNAKIKEMESWAFEASCHDKKGQISNEGLVNCTVDMSQPLYEESNTSISSSIKLKSNSLFQDHGFLIQNVGGKDYDNSDLLKAMKERLQEAKSILQDLEKSVQVTHYHSLSLSGSSGIVTSTGVSKLIRAFESKVHHVGGGVDEVPSTLGDSPEDSYALLREQTLSLSNTLNRIELELGMVEIHAMGNLHNREALKKYKLNCDNQKHKNNSLQVAFDELAKKVTDYESKVFEMPNHIDELHRHVNVEAAGFLDEIELLKREVSEDVFILKQEKDVLLGMILEAVGKLDASTGLKVLEDLDTRTRIMFSVDASILRIEELNGKLEKTNHNYNTLQDLHKELNNSFMDIEGRHSLIIELFYKFYNNLLELIHEAQQKTTDAAIIANVEKVLEFLPEKCEMVINYLRNLLSEQAYLLSRYTELYLDLSIRNQEILELNTQLKELELQSNISEELEFTLLNKTKEIEEIKRRCFFLSNQLEDHESCKDLDAHARSCEKDEVVSKDANVVDDSFNSLLLRLEELVSFHLGNYDEILEKIILSRKHLQDAHMVMEVSADDCLLPLPTLISHVIIPKVIKLHEKLKLLTASNVQKETEIQILKEGMSKIEETLEASCHEFQLKASEVEQLEQKLFSVREKLSIAVAKGKGLIVQRDSLKQTLMEKTSELEKSAEELLLKDALLDELETKLKACSEVERVESLESELSYIRNSATVLRDSFLQKDSVLQRIEEVLDDLELPDFHDKDILEKIELLSRFGIDHPSTVTGLKQKSLDERTHSDAEVYAVIDDNKNCMWPSSNQVFDELKRKHEELQGKFYNLVEHNNMLEQSLLERNNLVQKWEEILDRIELPSHMQTMEPEDKIELLGRELSKVMQERDSLLLKIDNLEISSDMQIVDIEETHKKISELTAEVLAVKSEKEFFSESLERLRFDYFALSEKVILDEQDRENLQKELDDLQDKLIDNSQFEYYKDMENNLQKIYYLVNSTLTENNTVDLLSGGSLVEQLEESLRKLIDNYNVHLNKSCNVVPIIETLLDESNSDHVKMVPDECSTVHDKMVPEETLLAKESDLASMSLELDRISNKLASVEQDRDAIFVKYQSLMLVVENLKMQVDVLNVERNAELKKYQSLALELDAMEKQRDTLQEQLTQEEQKTASVKEKLNLAVRKGKGLVQQRDSLKQTVDEMNTLLEQLKIDHRQQAEALISEKSLLMHRLADVELNFQDNNQNYNRLLTALHAIDLQSETNDIDPVEKLGVVSSILLDMPSSIAAAEHEANKSKRAAELLLTELNEVQERNDILQDELVKTEASLAEYSKQKDDSLSRLDYIMSVHFEERTRLAKNLMDSMLVVDQLRVGLLRSSRILSEVLSKDVGLFHFVDDLREFTLDEFCSSDRNSQPFLLSSDILSSNDQKNEEISLSISDTAQFKMHQNLDETLLCEHFALANQALHECMSHCNELRDRIGKHSVFLDMKMVYLSETVDAVKRKNSSLKDISESLKRDIAYLESKLKEKDAKMSSIYTILILLYEACSTSVIETVKRKSQITGNSQTLGEDVLNLGIVRTLPSYANLEEVEDVHSINDYIKTMIECILSTVKDASSTNELVERTERELKSTIFALQRDLQEKDIQMNRVYEELVFQIKDAETVAKRSMAELVSSRAEFSNLEKKAEAMETNRNLIELRLNELQDVEALSKLLQERVSSLTGIVNAKDQEIEALMQALDEEEIQMEALQSRNTDMENLFQQRVTQLETLETSYAKTTAKLSTTVSKFDELRNLSESLLLEVENLQPQLLERDSEISFLRQEVTKCTNDLLASQENNKKYSSEIQELLTWMKGIISHFGGHPVQFDDQEANQIHLYIDILGKKIASAINELEELRATVQCKDALLETERGRIEELLSRTEGLESTLHAKERLEQSHGGRGSEQQSSSYSSGTLEIEQMVQRNKVSSGPVATIGRSGRKVNNDQIAIAIDSEKYNGALEDDDDDKAHGFKSLTKSRLIPRASRPIADRIDGIWVSAERLLMRQPTLRLAFFVYWVTLHALLASFI